MRLSSYETRIAGEKYVQNCYAGQLQDKGHVTVHLGVKRLGCPSVFPWCDVIGCCVEERLPVVLIYVNDGTPSAYVTF
jgi:hypothetical protein